MIILLTDLFFKAIFNLEPSFLDQYTTEPLPIYFNDSNVIPLFTPNNK